LARTSWQEGGMLRRLLSRAVAVSQRLFARAGGTVAVAVAQGAAVAGVGAASLYGIVAVLVPAFLFLYGLDAFPLRDNNEGLYAEIAREMLATGHYVVPHLNGVPYIEKPPLLYWLSALSMALLGPTPAAARLVSASSMLLLCVALFQFCRLHGNPRAGCLASVGLASALPVSLISHVVLFDPLLTALLGASLLCYLHGYLVHRRRAHLLAALLLALATLEKGAVALVLAGGTVGSFLLLMRDRTSWRRALDPPALAIVLLVAGSWHLLAALEQDGFGRFYFVNEHLLRFLGRRLPDDYHHGPLWFYLPRLPLMLLPWTPFLLLLLRRPGAPVPAQGAIVKFCQAAILFPFAFFSLSQAKADYYLLVAVPALALLLAVEAALRLQVRGDRRLALCWGMSAASAVLLLVLAPMAATLQLTTLSLLVLGLGWSVLAAAGARWFASLRSLLERELAMLGIALASALALVLTCASAAQRGVRDSSWYLARIVLAQRDAPALFIYRDYEDVFSTLPFYLGRTVPVIDSGSRDLQFGCASVPGRACVSRAEFLQLRARRPVAVAVQASHAAQFLAMAGTRGWRVEWVGEKMLFFSEP
jgi:4-amino-4-deoxy-L-arabinose transferase-like glycosyltransferase